MATRVLTLIQARTGSTRLPEKVLFPLGPTNVLAHLIDRVKAARWAGTVVVATTTEREDQTIASLCRKKGVACFSGHPTDLLDRHYQALRHYPADVVVRVPANCPLLDPRTLDRVVGYFLEHRSHYDYVSNLRPRTDPDGNEVEVMSAEALEIAYRESQLPSEREHPTAFLWGQPERFSIGNRARERALPGVRRHRWKLDYWEDYLVIRSVFHALYPENPVFGTEAIQDWLDAHPTVASLNQAYQDDAPAPRSYNVFRYSSTASTLPVSRIF